ncbi:hypothetical protein MTR_3g084890 [Medicago truncatula]|uniref:HMA domain-containing protein n=1 Tax=Medicago truncatula TaxID=3880 RepID=G7JBD6_MEDTR|nr:hypothetical protein MTR_3g084890 [Medicago truncatula]
MESHRNMTCILRVDTQSSGWEKSITKVIKSIKDVSFNIDATHGIIRISGAIDPIKLLTEIKKAGKHAELIAADISGNNNGGSVVGHSHPNSNHRHAELIATDFDGSNNSGRVVGHSHPNSNNRNEYMNNEYNGNHGHAYHYNGNHGSRYGYGYNEYDGRHGNVVPYYNHNQSHSDPYQYNGVLAPHAPSASEQMQHQQIQHYYDDDANNNCVIM